MLYFGYPSDGSAPASDNGGFISGALVQHDSSGMPAGTFVCPGSGPQVIAALQVYGFITTGSSTAKIGIYTQAGALVSQQTVTIDNATPQWWGIGASEKIVGGNSYILAFEVNSDSIKIGVDAGEADNYKWTSVSYSSAMPSTLPAEDGGGSSKYGIRCGVVAEVTKVVDPDAGSGYDYDSLYDWESAQQGDLTGARNEIAVAKCRCTGGTADTTVFVVDGWTTSATQYIKIWTDPSESYRHNGTYQTGNKYRIESTATSGNAIRILYEWVTIDGIQIYKNPASATSDSTGISFYTEISSVTIKNCIIKGNDNFGSTYWAEGILRESNSTANSFVITCIVYDFHCTYGLAITNDSSSSENLYIYNCLASHTGENYDAIVGTNCIVKNCIAYLCNNGFAGDCDYCSDSYDTLTALGGTGNRVNQTFSFVDAANKNFHLARNDAGAAGYGLNLYNDATYPFQDDIDGTDRGGSGVAWDIGADQYNPIILSYRTAADPTALAAAAWTDYTVPFTSLGYVQLKAAA
jgi:hypothetical protein